MRLFFFALAAYFQLSSGSAVADEKLRALLIKHKFWTMYWEITETASPGERAHKLNYEFFERDEKLMARLLFEYGGCDFPVGLRSDGISLRYCILEGEPSLSFDPNDVKYPFKQRNNPRKLWFTPTR
jgi:hypothetical protein